MLLTPGTFRSKGQESGMNLADSFEFGLSYAETLKSWRDGFERARPHVCRPDQFSFRAA
jgi:cyclopropane-fatty-acyl-phospholipid synthase